MNPLAESIARDVRTASRSLRSSRAFALTVVTTLALAIGANTVIFSAVEAVLFRPLPVPGLGSLIAIGHRVPAGNLHGGLPAAEVFDLEKRHDLFAALAGYRSVDLNLTGSGAPEHIPAVSTTGGFFEVFGIPAYLGRLYTSDDERRGATSVVVLSYDLWRALTGGDVGAIGRTLRLNDSSYTLIGVLPPGFEYPLGAQLWTPKPLDIYLDRRATDNMLHAGSIVPTIARMKRGVTLPRVQSELVAAMSGWAARQPQYYGERAPRPIEARAFVATWAGQLRPILVLLIGAVALVLVIACANVGSLQLLRTTGRAREIAVRMALGGSRAAIIRQFAIETLLLTVGGGAVGVAFAEVLIVTVGRVAAVQIPELHALHLDPLVLACSAGVTILAAVFFGIGPALRAASASPSDAMVATGSRGHSSGAARSRFLRGAVVVQVALALMLLLSCGVAVYSVRRLLAVDPGFDPSHVITARLRLPASRYGDGATLASATEMLAFHKRLLSQLRASPGIEAASATDVTPFGYRGVLDAAVHHTAAAAEVGPDAARNSVVAAMWAVDADYFHTMGIPIRAGTGFSGHEQDDEISAYPKQLQVDVVIDERLARRLFPDQDAVGKMIGPWTPGFRVVGVVGSVKQSDLRATVDDDGAIYFATAGTQSALTFVVRTRLPIGPAAAVLRHVVYELDPTLAVYEIEPLSAMVSRSVGPRQIASWLLVGFAGLSLILALLGLYGVLSYTTSQRTKELGIRMALGATPGEVLAMVARGAASLTAMGVLIGTVGYVAIERSLSAITYGVDAGDPLMIAAAAAALAGVGLLASLPAAIRAARVDPVQSLRAD
jgi:putative ABC transport system permease protein